MSLELSIFMLSLSTVSLLSMLSLGLSSYTILALASALLSQFQIWSSTICFLSNPAFLLFALSSSWALLVFFCGLVESSSSSSNPQLLAATLSLVAGFLMLFASTMLQTILSFELMMLCALFLLRSTSKSDSSEEALVEMAIWAVLGSFFLLVVTAVCPQQLIGSGGSSSFTLSLFLVLGFAIKVPLWPFMSWLLKAHVEASTEFSIFLSGLLVKFGVWGLVSSVCQLSHSSDTLLLVSSLAVVGIFDAVLSLFAQVDLNSIVAILTVIETNWTLLCLASQSPILLMVGAVLILAHCLTTTIEFGLVELIYSSMHSSSLLILSGLSTTAPLLTKLSWASALITIGLPGTSIFILKFIFLTELLPYSVALTVLISLAFLVALPIFLVSVWSSALVGQASTTQRVEDCSLSESLLIVVAILFSLVLGFNPTLWV